LDTSIKVGVQPEGARNPHLETVINYIRQFFWKKKNNKNNKVLAVAVAKFSPQWLFTSHFPEISLFTLN